MVLIDFIDFRLNMFSGAEPYDAIAPSMLDAFCSLLQRKLAYAQGELDMCYMHHEFTVTTSQSKRLKLISSLCEIGKDGGETAMALTVGLPAAIGTRLILDNAIDLRGVHIPLGKQFYLPILDELDRLGIRFKHVTVELD